jgi:hypothetical protein
MFAQIEGITAMVSIDTSMLSIFHKFDCTLGSCAVDGKACGADTSAD